MVDMKIGIPIAYEGGFAESAARIADYERAGLDLVSLPEAYSFDSVSQLGYLAAKTSTVELTSSILNIYSRTPALLAMTAAGLDYVSAGRFTLGIGSSGPQVIEGFHGVRYDASAASRSAPPRSPKQEPPRSSPGRSPRPTSAASPTSALSGNWCRETPPRSSPEVP
jgi:Luciferase-like monooxygenase